MSYKISAKNRRLKKTLLNIYSFLKFESLNIDISRKIILFWVFLWFFSLFWNWIESIEQPEHIWNSFKNILWIVWYLLFLLNIIILIIIFNLKLKENIKFLFNFDAKDWVIVVFLWLFWFLLTVNSLFIIKNFSYFNDWIFIWKWIIISIIWYIFILIWWILMLKTKTNTSIHFEWDEYWRKIKDLNNIEKNNMKLPF